MAPHAESPSRLDTGYLPPAKAVAALKKALETSSSQSAHSDVDNVSCPSTIIDDLGRQYEPLKDENILHLGLAQLQELEDAMQSFEETGLPLCMLQAATFPLPTLGPKIRERSVMLSGPQPFFVIRGIRPTWYSKRRNVLLYMGIASYVGTKRAMAAADPAVIHHVTNMCVTKDHINKGTYIGPANTTNELPFHTDSGEIVAFYCLSQAAEGGNVLLADINDIIPRVMQQRPDIIDVLKNTWMMVNPKHEQGVDERPLLFEQPGGRLQIHCSRARIFGPPSKPRPDYLPSLSADQIEAVDALHVAAHSVKHRLNLNAGDMLFFSNLQMMHAREAFVDGQPSDGTSMRYLLRLILRDEGNKDWHLPRELESTWAELYGHRDEDEEVPVKAELFSYKASH